MRAKTVRTYTSTTRQLTPHLAHFSNVPLVRGWRVTRALGSVREATVWLAVLVSLLQRGRDNVLPTLALELRVRQTTEPMATSTASTVEQLVAPREAARARRATRGTAEPAVKRPMHASQHQLRLTTGATATSTASTAEQLVAPREAARARRATRGTAETTVKRPIHASQHQLRLTTEPMATSTASTAER